MISLADVFLTSYKRKLSQASKDRGNGASRHISFDSRELEAGHRISACKHASPTVPFVRPLPETSKREAHWSRASAQTDTTIPSSVASTPPPYRAFSPSLTSFSAHGTPHELAKSRGSNASSGTPSPIIIPLAAVSRVPAGSTPSLRELNSDISASRDSASDNTLHGSVRSQYSSDGTGRTSRTPVPGVCQARPYSPWRPPSSASPNGYRASTAEPRIGAPPGSPLANVSIVDDPSAARPATVNSGSTARAPPLALARRVPTPRFGRPTATAAAVPVRPTHGASFSASAILWPRPDHAWPTAAAAESLPPPPPATSRAPSPSNSLDAVYDGYDYGYGDGRTVGQQPLDVVATVTGTELADAGESSTAEAAAATAATAATVSPERRPPAEAAHISATQPAGQAELAGQRQATSLQLQAPLPRSVTPGPAAAAWSAGPWHARSFSTPYGRSSPLRPQPDEAEALPLILRPGFTHAR